MKTFTPTYTTMTVEEPNPDPVGSAEMDAAYRLAGKSNSPKGGMTPAFGPKGDISRSFAGDLGPVQGDHKVLLRAGAPGLLAKGESKGLPISKIPSADLVNADVFSVQSQFGVR